MISELWIFVWLEAGSKPMPFSRRSIALREMPTEARDRDSTAKALTYWHSSGEEHRRLLRVRRERPGGRAAKQRDECAPSCMSRKEHCEG
jgi:hypothetical protein